MGTGGYRHNNKGFCEILSFQKSINRGRATIIEVSDEAFYVVVKTHKRQSKKIYNSKLPMIKI